MGTATAATNHATRGTTADDDDGIVRRALDRHAQRRRQGIPTLSVLFAGDTDDGGEAAWHRWVGARLVGLRAVNVPWPRTAGDFRALEGGVAPLWTPPTPPGPGAMHPSPPPAGMPEGGAENGLAVAMNLLAERLERGVPPGAWVCGLLVPSAGAAAYLADAPESRAKAYFREGLVVPLVAAPGGVDQEVAGEDGGRNDTALSPARAAARRALAAAGMVRGDGGKRATAVNAAADALDAALTLATDPTADNATGVEPPPDRARSAAERFLFAVLEALPETTGLFALNAPLPGGGGDAVRFGSRPAEVDLLAAGPRVAVEVDGYHHFTDADRYRRDRRKDVLLQAHGFLVLRFLADDVVPRLEETLDAIRAAVVRRR